MHPKVFTGAASINRENMFTFQPCILTKLTQTLVFGTSLSAQMMMKDMNFG